MKNYIVLLCLLQLRKRLGVSESNLLLLLLGLEHCSARDTTTMPSTHNTKLMKFTKIALAFLSLATALQLVNGERLRLEDHKREQAEEGYEKILVGNDRSGDIDYRNPITNMYIASAIKA